MRLLANENIPEQVIAALRKAGHDIVWIRLLCPGATDSEVIIRALKERRIILTFDKDFGELAFRHRRVAPGIILLRLTLSNPRHIVKVITMALSAQIRLIRLPRSPA